MKCTYLTFRRNWAPGPQLSVWDFCSSIMFQNCKNLDKIWFVSVRQWRQALRRAGQNPKLRKLPILCRHAHFLQTLSWISASRPSFFFYHLVTQVFPRIWHVENSSAMLWNLRYYEKNYLTDSFTSTFSLNVTFSLKFHMNLNMIQNSWPQIN